MFCHECGKELREGARFCFSCGTPVRENSETAESVPSIVVSEANSGAEDAVDTEQPVNPETTADYDNSTASEHSIAPRAAAAGDTEQPVNLETTVDFEESDASETTANAKPTTGNSETAVTGTAATFEQSAPTATSDTAALPDLVLKKGKVVVSGNELRLNGKHYARKTGKKKFKKKKESTLLFLEKIHCTAMEHKKYGGRMFLALLLLACFAAGGFFSAQYGYNTYEDLIAPYQVQALTELENTMDLIDNSGAKKLIQYQDSLDQNNADVDALKDKMVELEKQQSEELLKSIYTDNRFDLDTFFNSSFFTKAYQEYMKDLLNAFKEDELLNSWLHNYYETAKQYGGNYFLDTDLWIYSGNEENMFSPDLDSVSGLMRIHYDLDLYEHMLYMGHIYITASDFMKEVLSLPRYTVDEAVFANAYGGVPDASAMTVPGWSRSHYEEFWLYGADYYNIDTPMWLDYGLSSTDFNLDWNGLVNEEAYYTAYKNFMDKIAPGLPCYDMVSYHSDDGAYGGMGFELKGTEANVNDIVAAYADTHPNFIDEVKKQGVNTEGLTTSVDEDIAKTQTQLEELEAAIPILEEEKHELEQLLADANIYRQEYAALLADIENHERELTYRLIFWGSITLLCIIFVLICLCKFFGFMKRPRHLLVIKQDDLEYAINAKRYSKKNIADLQDRLPKQENPQA